MTNAITIVKIYLNLIFNKTQKRTPIAAMILSHAALQADRYIPMHNIAKQTIIMILCDVLMLGKKINAIYRRETRIHGNH